jgi:hypothetical protein
VADTIPDSFWVPNADGTGAYVFNGRVHAAGLDLDAGTSATPPDTDRVRWLRTSDGVAVATLFAYTPQNVLELAGIAPTAADNAQTILGVLDAGGNHSSYLRAYHIAGGNPSDVVEVFGGAAPTRRLLDNAGASDFAQLAALSAVSFGFSKAHSTAAFTYSAADTNRRVYAPARTLDFDSMGAVHAVNTYFVAPRAGKYLVLFVIDQLTVAGNVMVGAIKNDATMLRSQTCNCALGTDAGFKGGTLM